MLLDVHLIGFVFLKYLKGDSAFIWIEKLSNRNAFLSDFGLTDQFESSNLYKDNLPTNDDNVFVAYLLLE